MTRNVQTAKMTDNSSLAVILPHTNSNPNLNPNCAIINWKHDVVHF